jgi:hypothetical protein
VLLTVGVESITEPEVELVIDVCAAVDVVGFMPATELVTAGEVATDCGLVEGLSCVDVWVGIGCISYMNRISNSVSAI